MRDFAQLCEKVAATTKKTEKTRLIADYFQSNDRANAAIAACFLSGRAFPAFDESVLSIGGALIWRVLTRIAGVSADDISRAYRSTGDTGSAAEIVLRGHVPSGPPLTLAQVEEAFRRMAHARGPGPKAAELEALLRRAEPTEVKFILKIITGDLRIGSRESLVEDAIAQAFSETTASVRRANMLLGDVGEALRLAQRHELASARMRMFHPLGFMLASPAETSTEAFECFSDAAVEDKYDGVRAQAHCSGGRVKLFSRTLDEITESFPDVAAALSGMPEEVILDGEILAWDGNVPTEGSVEGALKEDAALTHFHTHRRGRALPFSALQKRLGRKRVSRSIMEQVSVAYVCFDVIFCPLVEGADSELVIDRPLQDRLELLDRVFERFAKAPTLHPQAAEQKELFAEAAQHSMVLRAPVVHAASAEELDVVFDKARARGNEGLMIKDLAAPYQPGRRGRSWLKLKRELATLDVVVTAAEWGNGRKSQWLSDYTFAVRDGDHLLNVGKAYSGVTDAEIQRLTEHFQQNTIVDNGHYRLVHPDTVFEVAFNNIMRSDRHESGYALRFPRIIRIRDDKSAQEADTLERVREIFESEIAAGRAGRTDGPKP